MTTLTLAAHFDRSMAQGEVILLVQLWLPLPFPLPLPPLLPVLVVLLSLTSTEVQGRGHFAESGLQFGVESRVTGVDTD